MTISAVLSCSAVHYAVQGDSNFLSLWNEILNM